MQCLAKNIFSSNFSYRKITSITQKGQPDKGPSIKDIGNLKWEWRSQFFFKNLQCIGLKNCKHGGWGCQSMKKIVNIFFGRSLRIYYSQGMCLHGSSGCTNPKIFGTSPFAPADIEAHSSLLQNRLRPQIQIPNACPESPPPPSLPPGSCMN